MAKQKIWKVFYHGSFWHHRARDHAGTEISIQKSFDWDGNRWCVPAVYACADGLVVDILVEVPPEKVQHFLDKWEPRVAQGSLSEDERRKLDAENPLHFDFHAQPILNGKPLKHDRGSGMSWIPEQCTSETAQNAPQMRPILAHYGLDPSRGWAVWRETYHWATARKPKITSLCLTLQAHPSEFAADRKIISCADETTTITHPRSGSAHTLRVHEYEQQELDPSIFRNDTLEYPTHCTAIQFTLSPEPPEDFTLTDCCEGDRPREKQADPSAPKASHYAALIGFTRVSHDTVTLPDGTAAKLRTTCSSLYFQPPHKIVWQAVFREKTIPDTTVELI